MKRTTFLFILIGLAKACLSQIQPIDVTDQTIKLGGLGGEQTLNFGFAEGDQIIFNFKEVDGKELKMVDITEYPSTPVFSDYKTKEIYNKTLNVQHKCIYTFHFSNSALGGRICKIHIQRIPASEATKNFNTNVYTQNIPDTTYSIENEKFLVKSDTTQESVTKTKVVVHSSLHYLKSDNSNTVEFILPSNTKLWSYYIGVDEAGEKAFNEATDKFLKSAVGTLVKATDPLIAMTLYGVSFFNKMSAGDEITYMFLDGQNQNLYCTGQQCSYIKKNTVINDFAKMDQPTSSGTYYLKLFNDNTFKADNVFIRIVAICVNQQWDTRQVKKMHVENKEGMFLKN